MTRINSLQKNQAGFALVEILVSAVIVVIMAAGTLVAIQSSQRTSAEERHRATAHGLAQEDQARLRALRISDLSNLTQTRNLTADDGSYTVLSKAEFVTDSTGTASCQQGTAAPDYIRISSKVTWPSIGSRPPILLQSIVAPPNGSISDTKGALAISVNGGQGQPIPNIALSGSGAGSFSGVTSDNGCVIFGNLPAGNYTLNTTAPGMVDKDGKAPVATATSVVALSTNTLALQLDRPGGLDLSFTTRRGSGALIPSSAKSIVVFNTGMTSAAVFSVPSRQATVNASPLFPFSSPDTAYAGACTGDNPNPSGSPTGAGRPATAAVQILADSTVPATIQLPALNLTVYSGSSASSPGSVLSNANVVLTDATCRTAGTTVIHRLTTNSSGQLADPGLPWSVYDVCVSNGTKASTTTNVSVKNLTSGTNLTVYMGAAATGSCP